MRPDRGVDQNHEAAGRRRRPALNPGWLPPNSAKRADLLRWYARLLSIMGGRVLSVNARVADEWAKLQAEVRAKNLVLAVVDGLLAATARRYKLTIATDNVKDFKAVAVKVFNPFD